MDSRHSGKWRKSSFEVGLVNGIFLPTPSCMALPAVREIIGSVCLRYILVPCLIMSDSGVICTAWRYSCYAVGDKRTAV